MFSQFDSNISRFQNEDPRSFMDGSYTTTHEEGIDEHGNPYTREIYTSKDGKRRYSKLVTNCSFNQFRGSGNKEKELEDLNEKLAEAISKEQFEVAAKLRDKIADLKKKMGKSSANKK